MRLGQTLSIIASSAECINQLQKIGAPLLFAAVSADDDGHIGHRFLMQAATYGVTVYPLLWKASEAGDSAGKEGLLAYELRQRLLASLARTAAVNTVLNSRFEYDWRLRLPKGSKSALAQSVSALSSHVEALDSVLRAAVLAGLADAKTMRLSPKPGDLAGLELPLLAKPDSRVEADFQCSKEDLLKMLPVLAASSERFQSIAKMASRNLQLLLKIQTLASIAIARDTAANSRKECREMLAKASSEMKIIGRIITVFEQALLKNAAVVKSIAALWRHRDLIETVERLCHASEEAVPGAVLEVRKMTKPTASDRVLRVRATLVALVESQARLTISKPKDSSLSIAAKELSEQLLELLDSMQEVLASCRAQELSLVKNAAAIVSSRRDIARTVLQAIRLDLTNTTDLAIFNTQQSVSDFLMLRFALKAELNAAYLPEAKHRGDALTAIITQSHSDIAGGEIWTSLSIDQKESLETAAPRSMQSIEDARRQAEARYAALNWLTFRIEYPRRTHAELLQLIAGTRSDWLIEHNIEQRAGELQTISTAAQVTGENLRDLNLSLLKLLDEPGDEDLARAVAAMF